MSAHLSFLADGTVWTLKQEERVSEMLTLSGNEQKTIETVVCVSYVQALHSPLVNHHSQQLPKTHQHTPVHKHAHGSQLSII